MGKKKKDAFKVKSTLPHSEAYTRMNFLYQAANMTLATNPENLELSRFYTATMKAIGAKLLCKMDPNIKRTVCKHCHSLLVPGITCKVRMRARRESHIVVKCLDCGRVKRFNTSKEHKLWTEQEFKTTHVNAETNQNKQFQQTQPEQT